MSLPAAVVSVLKKYVKFSGRARRSEYWWWTLVVAVIMWIADAFIMAGPLHDYQSALANLQPGDTQGLIDAITTFFGATSLTSVVALPFILPGLAVATRRLHDTGKSGLRILLLLIPIANIVLGIMMIVWLATAGTVGPNRFGEDPKAVAPVAPVPAGV